MLRKFGNDHSILVAVEDQKQNNLIYFVPEVLLLFIIEFFFEQ